VPTITRTITINTIIPVIPVTPVTGDEVVLEEIVLVLDFENQLLHFPDLVLVAPEFNGSKLFINFEFPPVLIYR